MDVIFSEGYIQLFSLLVVTIILADLLTSKLLLTIVFILSLLTTVNIIIYIPALNPLNAIILAICYVGIMYYSYLKFERGGPDK
jgi:hypothetical protein